MNYHFWIKGSLQACDTLMTGYTTIGISGILFIFLSKILGCLCFVTLVFLIYKAMSHIALIIM